MLVDFGNPARTEWPYSRDSTERTNGPAELRAPGRLYDVSDGVDAVGKTR